MPPESRTLRSRARINNTILNSLQIDTSPPLGAQEVVTGNSVKYWVRVPTYCIIQYILDSQPTEPNIVSNH